MLYKIYCIMQFNTTHKIKNNMQKRSRYILKSSRMIFDEESCDILTSDVNYVFRRRYFWNNDCAFPLFPTYFIDALRDDDAWLQHFNYHLCSIELCLEGAFEYRTDSESFILKPGEIFIIVPHSNVMIRNAEPGRKRQKLTLLVNGSNCAVICENLGFHRAFHLFPENPGEIEKRMRHIGKLIRENGSHRRAAEEIYSLMLLLAEEKRNSECGQPPEMLELCSFLNNNFSRQITLAEMAALLGVSTATLRRKFIQFFSLPPLKYLNRLRLKNSAEMLKNSTLPVKVIGFRCGFTTPLHFTRSFKEFFNCTPTEFRENLSHKEDME